MALNSGPVNPTRRDTWKLRVKVRERPLIGEPLQPYALEPVLIDAEVCFII